MAKREFIDKEKLINDMKISSMYHAENTREETLLYRDRNIVREQPTFTEQDIVKPYLELLLKEMQSLEEINNSDDRYDKGYQHGRASCEAMVMHMIGNLLSEQGDTE